MEPITMSLAGALLYRSVAHEGLLGKVFEDLFGENANKVVERILHSLGDALKAGTLPVNHDLRRAGLDSLRKAGLVLADALVRELDPSLKKESWTARIQRRSIVANWMTAGAGPEMAWVERLLTVLKDETKLKVLDDAVLQIATDSTNLLQANVDLTLAAKLHGEFAAWVHKQVEGYGKPESFQRFLSDGWPVEQGTLTLYQAYCLFFRESLKHDQAVCNIFTGNALTEIKNELASLSRRGEVNVEEINSRIQKAFGQSLDQQLGGLHNTVKRGFDQVTATLQDITTQLQCLVPSTLLFARVREADVYAYDDPAAFSPSRREFEEGCVHRPALADRVQAELIDTRFACLLGKGASGKTTLALLLAFSKPFGPERSYYLDLANTDDNLEAADPYRAAMHAIARQHGRDALVIVDNIHLAEGLAHKLHIAWCEDGQPVRLLLQGRFTQQGADRRGRQSPLEGFKRTALVLEVLPNDLAGVLQRLVRRANGNHLVSTIPPAVLGQWLKIFGGELIGFSSAVRRKLPKIVRGQYQLTEADAADYIRDEYLENPKRPITLAERENLLAIAACADWELSVPAEGLLHPPGSALAASMKRGLVWQSTHGRFGQFARYRLCHPGMGKLL
jgi:hypothetical protein